MSWKIQDVARNRQTAASTMSLFPNPGATHESSAYLWISVFLSTSVSNSPQKTLALLSLAGPGCINASDKSRLPVSYSDKVCL